MNLPQPYFYFGDMKPRRFLARLIGNFVNIIDSILSILTLGFVVWNIYDWYYFEGPFDSIAGTYTYKDGIHND